MKYCLLICAFLLGSSSAFAEKPRCQAQVEKENPGLARESKATPESKSDLIRKITNLETTLDSETARYALKLLREEGTLAFSFGNDAGKWLSIARARNCEVLMTTQMEEY